MNKTFLSMSNKDLRKCNVINQLVNGYINGTEASKKLNLSVRQVRRLKGKFIKQGEKGLIHGHRGEKSNRALPKEVKEEIIKLIKKNYPDFGPTLAAEKLDEIHKITCHFTTIRKIMIEEDLWQSRKKKTQTSYRRWREPKHRYGEMVQFDGSYEYWFEQRAEKCCLLAAIDDATGRIVQAKFVQNESVMSVFAFFDEYLKQYGKPENIYLDKFSTYKINHPIAKENHDIKTQFQRAMDELRIETISANSPQAKGRVERLFETLQDRLIKELRLQGISHREIANCFLEKIYIKQFNDKFGKESKKQGNQHQRLSQAELKKLPSILSRQTIRTVNNDYTISYNNQWYQLTKQQPATIQRKDKVIIEERINGSLHIQLRGKYLNFEKLPSWAKRAPVRKRQIEKMWVLPATAKGIGEAVEQMAAELTKNSHR